MPAIASLTVNDSAAVAHTFSPVTTDGRRGQWQNRAPGVPALMDSLSVEMLPPQGTRTVYRFKLGLYNPIVDAVVAGKVGRYNSVDLTINLAPDSTETERRDTMVMLQQLLATSLIDDVVQYVEPPY